MGRFRSKLKGQTKGKRWPKGQSSSSNPETKKFRDQAKSRFFQDNLGPSSLTEATLKRHDALQLFSNTSQKPTEMETENSDGQSESSYGTYTSYQSMKSFASEWSDCSNMSFGKFMNTFHADSALHKQMLAVLAAITEVIKQNGGTESSTEYYCSLLTTLETVYNNEDKNEEQITAVLALLNMGIKTVPEPVLCKNFNDVALKMLLILKDFSSAENNVIIKSTLGILTTILRAQELAMWSHDTTKQIFNAILNPFCIHSKPKWRKAAQGAVAAIVKAPCFKNNPSHNIPAEKCAVFCEGILENCLGSGVGKVSSIQAGQTTILHTLGLLKETIRSFSKSYIKKCCETILRLMTLNYPIVNSCGLQVIHSLFTSQQPVISSDLNAKLITALYEYQPANTDVQPTLAWLLVMQEAHVHLGDVDVSMAINLLPKLFITVSQMWLSGKTEVISAATHCLEVLLKDVIGPASEKKESILKYYSKLEKCFNVIHLCLSYQYNAVWSQVLHIIGIMFDVAGMNCSDMFVETLKTLAELRDSFKFSYNSELEYAVGAAIRSIGPERVLDIIPLKKENGDLNIDRSWLLPVLKENIKCSTLRYFREGIFPLARYCQQRSVQLAQANDGIGAHSSELLYLQLWNLLPCFCINPTDIKEEFKSLAKMLGLAISERKELRLSVMASLRKLIQSATESKNEEDLLEISRFDKNYLPILFNVYTTKPIGTDEEGQRLASLETIKMYLKISRSELKSQLFYNAVERLNTSSDEPEDHFIKESILDLIRALIPYQSMEGIDTIYQQCVKNLPDIKNNKEQKKAYRLLEEIVSSDSEGCKNFVKSNRKDVQKLLMKSLNTAATSSKGARLRCLNYLIKSQSKLDHESKLIRAAVPEAVMCCKDINEKCRETAYTLLNTIGEILMNHDQLDQYVIMLITGLAGTPQMVSSTILALASTLHNFSGALGQQNIKLILDNIIVLASSPTREIVNSCLSFVKVFFTALPVLMVQASLESILKVLCGMTDDCKRHFRIKVRDILDRLIRKYGAENITPFVPGDDQVMQKRIKNLRKLNDRKKKAKMERKEMKDEEMEEDFTVKSKPKTVEEILADSDSDLEEETDQNIPKSKNKINTWIEEDSENIVDFTDPTVVSKITATKPRDASAQIETQKKPDKLKNRGFKTAADGRLIIKDDDDDSDNENKRKFDKINLNSDSSDSEDESASAVETLLLSDRKRKRSGSVKSGMSTFSQPPSKYKAGGIGIHRPVNSASSVKSGMSSLGGDYKSKKAAGDVKRKGKKLDPYAYLPLQRNSLNKRKKAKGMGQLKSIVKGAKTGALKGAKAKKHRKTSM
ncbi:RRP12-like protein [Rhynchophorus ferrugineus]|uniref:RRP12-like protein n=1 Tax=Rhynchophorus ferrugineus TaxID=354439 RepID=UPI003FCD11E9